jgi:hypothetical protein
MKTIRSLFGIFIVVAAIYAGWKVVPVYITNYQFEEAIDDSARSGAADGRKTEEDIRMAVLQDAQDLKIPLQAEDIKVERNGSDLLISADYTVHVDLPGYPLDLSFHPASNRQSLRFR